MALTTAPLLCWGPAHFSSMSVKLLYADPESSLNTAETRRP